MSRIGNKSAANRQPRAPREPNRQPAPNRGETAAGSNGSESAANRQTTTGGNGTGHRRTPPPAPAGRGGGSLPDARRPGARPASQPADVRGEKQTNTGDRFDALADSLADALLDRAGDELVERIARRVVELQREEGIVEQPVDAGEVARRYGVKRDWVYRHAEELGAVRLGDGPRPRLRFHPERVEAFLRSASEKSLCAESPGAERSKPSRRRRRNGQRTDLLPIKGRRPPG